MFAAGHPRVHSFPTRRSSDLNGNSVWSRKNTSYRLSWDRTLSARIRSEEHTSELQSLRRLVCRLLLEKKKDSRFGADSFGHRGRLASRSRRRAQNYDRSEVCQ